MPSSQDTGLRPTGGGAEVEPGHDLGRRARRGDPPLGEQHQGLRQPGHLVDRVADIDDRHPALGAEPVEVGQDLRLARLVERGQRLVHQQQPRRRQQGPPDRDPLALAAREVAGAAVQQGADPEQLDHLAQPLAVPAAPRQPSGRRAGCAAR